VGVAIPENSWNAGWKVIKESIGQEGFVAYGPGLLGPVDAPGRTGQTLLALATMGREQSSQRLMSGWLVRETARSREAHAMVAIGMITSSLAIWRTDPTGFQRHMEEWRWYWTLAQQPNGSALFIPGKGNNGGEEYLGTEMMMNAAACIILTCPSTRLMMQGGMRGGALTGLLRGRIYTHHAGEARTLDSGRGNQCNAMATLRRTIEQARNPEAMEEANDILRRIEEWTNDQMGAARQAARDGDAITAAVAATPIATRFNGDPMASEAEQLVQRCRADAVLDHEFEAALILEEARGIAARGNLTPTGGDTSLRQACVNRIRQLLQRHGDTRAARQASPAAIEWGVLEAALRP
jgi:hypothetical protein